MGSIFHYTALGKMVLEVAMCGTWLEDCLSDEVTSEMDGNSFLFLLRYICHHFMKSVTKYFSVCFVETMIVCIRSSKANVQVTLL